MKGCGSRSIKIFPLNEGNFIFPENKIDKTEFLYFLNVFLVVEISFIPEMFKSIISFSKMFFLFIFDWKLFFNVSKKFISFCLNIKKLFFILFNFSFFSFSFFFSRFNNIIKAFIIFVILFLWKFLSSSLKFDDKFWKIFKLKLFSFVNKKFSFEFSFSSKKF